MGCRGSIFESVRPSGLERLRWGEPAHARCWVLRDRAGRLVEPYLVALTSVAGMVMGVGDRPYFENYTVDASIFVAQVYKGTRWMPWHQEPKKDVGICDKPRGVDNQTLIRGFPNGETRLEASPVTPS